jgi:vacuolar-type H+-ATPase subunit I/STV1
MRGKLGHRRSTFDCILSKSTFSPFDIQREYEHVITKEQALEEGRAWVDSLETKDRQELEKMLESVERFKRTRFSRLRDRYQTPQQAELLEYEIEAIREQLRQRGG